MTRWTFEEVRALGDRGDGLERVLARLVEEAIAYHGEDIEGSAAFADAVKLLRTMKLETTRVMLARCGVA